MTAHEVGYWLGEATAVGLYVAAGVGVVIAAVPRLRRAAREGWLRGAEDVRPRDVAEDVVVRDRFTWDGQTPVTITKAPDEAREDRADDE